MICLLFIRTTPDAAGDECLMNDVSDILEEQLQMRLVMSAMLWWTTAQGTWFR
jgi:hypothetical protein